MNVIFDYFLYIFLIIVAIILLTLKLKYDGGVTSYKKAFKYTIILFFSILLAFGIIKILDRVLQKHEVGIEIYISNNSGNIAEINIDGIAYIMEKNERKDIFMNYSSSGFIATRAGNYSRIWTYINERSIFQSNKRLTITINSSDSKARHFRLKLNTWKGDYEFFEQMIKLFMEKRQTST